MVCVFGLNPDVENSEIMCTMQPSLRPRGRSHCLITKVEQQVCRRHHEVIASPALTNHRSPLRFSTRKRNHSAGFYLRPVAVARLRASKPCWMCPPEVTGSGPECFKHRSASQGKTPYRLELQRQKSPLMCRDKTFHIAWLH